jgi:hypothetical protein
MTERELFEAWYCRKFSISAHARPTHMRKNVAGRYSNNGVQVHWETWQEARAEPRAA